MLKYIQRSQFVDITDNQLGATMDYNFSLVNLPKLLQEYLDSGLLTISTEGWTFKGDVVTPNSKLGTNNNEPINIIVNGSGVAEFTTDNKFVVKNATNDSTIEVVSPVSKMLIKSTTLNKAHHNVAQFNYLGNSMYVGLIGEDDNELINNPGYNFSLIGVTSTPLLVNLDAENTFIDHKIASSRPLRIDEDGIRVNYDENCVREGGVQIDQSDVAHRRAGLVINETYTDSWAIYGKTGNLRFDYNGVDLGEIDKVSGLYASISDASLKENVTPLNSEVLHQLEPKEYNFIGSTKKSFGLIAQEAEQHIPEIVRQIGNVKGIDYTSLIPFLISEVKKLKAEIELLKNGV